MSKIIYHLVNQLTMVWISQSNLAHRDALSARLCYDLPVTPSRSLIEDDWPVIRRLLPDDLEHSAREHGAMRRRRGQVNSAEQLLRLILMHVAGGFSLEQP